MIGMRKCPFSRVGVSAFLIFFLVSGGAFGQQATPISEPVSQGGQEVSLEPPGGGRKVEAGREVFSQALNPYGIAIPGDVGNVEDVFQGAPESPLVVHIQEAHANYEAQLNIKKILTQLHSDYKFSLIQLEGAASKLDPSIFQTAYLKEANAKLADYLMREGRLSGAEAFAVESKEPVELQGIEDRMLYMENLKTFRSVYAHQKEVDQFFKAMRVMLKDLRLKLLNEELLDLTRNMEAYAQEKIDLLDYLLYLNKVAESHKIASLKNLTEIVRFPNLVRILRLHELEESLDEKKLKTEAAVLKEAFARKTQDPEVEEILSSLADRKKGMKPRLYFKKLTSLSGEYGVDLFPYAQVRTMAEFLVLQDEVEHRGMFKEVHRLERLLQNRLLEKKNERRIITLLKYVELLEQYFQLEINREKLVFIMKRYAKMKPSLIKREIDTLARKYGILATDYAGDAAKLDGYMDEVEYFYRLVLERDRLFVRNILAKMKEAASDRTVLITGGFHTEGITDLLRKENISYVVVIPRLNVKEGNENYIKIMLEEDTAVGSVFAGTFALRQTFFTPDDVLTHPGSLATLAKTFLLSALLGNGLNAQQSYALTGQVAPSDLRGQVGVADAFNAKQPLIKVTSLPETFSVNAQTATVTTYVLATYEESGRVFQAKYKIDVSPDRFQMSPEGAPRELKGREAQGLNLTDASTVTTADVTGRIDLPSVLDRASEIEPRELEAVGDELADLGSAIRPILPGVITIDGRISKEALGILAQFENNPFALRQLFEEISAGNPVTEDSLRRIQALTQSVAITTADLFRAFAEQTLKISRLKALLATDEKPKPRILGVPVLLDETAASQRNGAAQLQSLVETLKSNDGAVAIVVGRGIRDFAKRVLGVDDRTLQTDTTLRRLRFVESGDEDAVDVLGNKIDTLAHASLNAIPRELRDQIDRSRLFENGYVRVLLPKDQATGENTVGDNLRQNLMTKGVIIFGSALRESNVSSDERAGRAYAILEIKAAHLVPTKEEAKERPTLLRDNDLNTFIVSENGVWALTSDVARLVQDLFADFLAAREVAIRA